MYPKTVTLAGLNKPSSSSIIKRSVEVANGKTVQTEILQENLKSHFHPWAVAQRAAAPKQRAEKEKDCQR
jgi:hypothetical protein